MAENQIQRVSVKHDAIMDFMIGNPTVPLSVVAAEFGLSQAWLSVVIHSDAFQAQLQEKKSGVFVATVIPLREKLVGVANLAVEKLGQVMENASTVSDKQFIVDTTDSILKNLGYSPKTQPVAPATLQQNNYFMQADREMLAAARDTMRQTRPPIEEKVIEYCEDTPTEKI